jgi:hypothetical protein
MTIDQAHQQAEHSKKLTAKGAEIIASLKDYITKEFSEHIKILDTSTDCRLHVTFYGLSLLFRVEIVWDSKLSATISACELSGVPQKVVALEVAYKFDSVGNIVSVTTAHVMDIKTFPSSFLAEVFSALQARTAILKP